MATIEGEPVNPSEYELMVDPSNSKLNDPQNAKSDQFVVVKPATCSGAWCAKNKKQMIILFLLLLIIVGVVIDTILKKCTVFELPATRNHRLHCDDPTDAWKNSTTFLCATGADPEWKVMSHNGQDQCGHPQSCVQVGIQDFLNWIASNVVLGFIVFMIAYIIACVLFIPASLLTIGAGVSFGAALGLGPGALIAILAVWLGALMGASVAFVLGRFIFRAWVEELAENFKYIRVIDKAVQIKGFLTVTLLRLSPAIPFSAFNYLMGATGVDFKAYVAGSAIGMLPGTSAYVFIGALVGSATRGSGNGSCSTGGNTIAIIIGVVGGIVTIIAIVVISIVAKRLLGEILENSPDGEIESENTADPLTR